MLTGEDLPEPRFVRVDFSDEAAKNALFAWMIAPSILWLNYCRQLYRWL